MFPTLYLLLIIIITIIVINRCFNKYNCMAATMTALPRIQISYDAADGLDGEDLPAVHDEVQLEDFFWTGSGDGPPDYLKRVHTGLSRGRDMVVKTETVVATVYVDGNNEIDVPICLDCYGSNDGNGGNWYDTMLGIGYGIDQLPLNYSTNDRRYWLLTVLSGFYNIKHKAVLEHKLAQLYRLAFTRQQGKHFGLINGLNEEKSSISLLNQSVEVLSTAKAERSLELADLAGNYSNDGEHQITIWPHLQRNSQSEWFSSSEEEFYESNPVTVTTAVYLNTSEIAEQMLVEESRLEYNPTVTWEYIDNTKEQLARSLDNSLFLEDVHIQIIIHNFTQLSEDDLKRFNGLNSAIYDADNTEKISDDRPIANQTELIYTVFVNGRPVLAVPAANDMKLVSETEVSNIVGKRVFMKAEPYLREPQATPLSPATRSSATFGFIDSIQSNSLLVLISTVALLLLLLLMLALLLMGRNNVLRRKSADAKRLANRNELLREQKMPEETVEGGGMTVTSRDVGTQNFSFENDSGYSPRNAQLYFPAPPVESRHKTNNNTSSDNTSDSSVYCPLQLDNMQSQRQLERGKSNNLVEQQQQTERNRGQYDRAETMSNEETIYTTIMSEKKRKRRLKRKYLSENRVGSLETSPVISEQHLFADEIVSVPTSRAAAVVTYENLKSNKSNRRNKVLEKREHLSDKSSDAGSIGSFLSMQSIRPFPKSSLPEPLSRVLEPVFVTYYDNMDNSNSQGHNTENIKESKGRHYRNHKGTSSSLVANLERFPSPKIPKKYTHLKSQSDNPDPGVLGPIVWERHKANLNLNINDNNMYGRIQQDPAALRTHYEGLLEGAMQIYNKQNHDPVLSSSEQNINSKEPLTKRENRGSSAGTTAIHLSSDKSYMFDRRPSTAVPAKLAKSNSSTQPPSPTIDAWYLGSNDALHSDLERPFSAGTYNNISPHSITKQHKILPRPNAAPLIAAIQHELHKYQQNEHKTTFNYQ